LHHSEFIDNFGIQEELVQLGHWLIFLYLLCVISLTVFRNNEQLQQKQTILQYTVSLGCFIAVLISTRGVMTTQDALLRAHKMAKNRRFSSFFKTRHKKSSHLPIFASAGFFHIRVFISFFLLYICIYAFTLNKRRNEETNKNPHCKSTTQCVLLCVNIDRHEDARYAMMSKYEEDYEEAKSQSADDIEETEEHSQPLTNIYNTVIYQCVCVFSFLISFVERFHIDAKKLIFVIASTYIYKIMHTIGVSERKKSNHTTFTYGSVIGADAKEATDSEKYRKRSNSDAKSDTEILLTSIVHPQTKRRSPLRFWANKAKFCSLFQYIFFVIEKC
ncbi:hypothetical protein RFI_30978, partial [Reticulomyxa filosa]